MKSKAAQSIIKPPVSIIAYNLHGYLYMASS